MRLLLLQHACTADIVLDLHCCFDASRHLFTLPSQAPRFMTLASRLNCAAVLTADVSGGNSFDEACSLPWHELARRYPSAGLDAEACAACVLPTLQMCHTMRCSTLVFTRRQVLLSWAAWLTLKQTLPPRPARPSWHSYGRTAASHKAAASMVLTSSLRLLPRATRLRLQPYTRSCLHTQVTHRCAQRAAIVCPPRCAVTLSERGCELYGWYRCTRAARAAAVPGV
jgi:hypothetical protein